MLSFPFLAHAKILLPFLYAGKSFFLVWIFLLTDPVFHSKKKIAAFWVLCLFVANFLRNFAKWKTFLPINREPMRESSSLEYDIKTNYENEKIYSLPIIPNRSLDRYGTNRHWKDNFLTSFIFLLASCFSFVLDVARYAFEPTTNHLLNNQIKSVQNLMTDLGLSQ